jgi:predicted nucleotidyltransferase
MRLRKILEDFDRAKEKIINKTKFKVSSSQNYDGLSMVIAYSDVMEYVVRELFDLTMQQLNNQEEKIAAFLYGSAGRREMICESDLDVMLIYKDGSQKYLDFKNKFKELVELFEFCKVDLPEWGTIAEAKTFAQKSITEGNQILESRFVCGNVDIRKNIEYIQDEFGNPERMERNIVFQKFYFEQYFKQRIRDGAINIKYCDGGSRDYLFIHWFDKLMERKYSDWNKAQKGRPVTEQGLYNLYQNGLISSLEFSKAIDALNFNLLLRNEILLINRGTSDEGLTFLDKKTLNSVFERVPELMKQYGIKSPAELSEQFDRQRFHIAEIKRKIWNLMIDEHGREIKNKYWPSEFHKAYSCSTSEKERAHFLDKKDLLIKIATIWGASNSNQTNLLDEICKREKDSDSWEIQASITASPHCNSDYLHYIATGIGKELGYGYILRIISRNPNVKRETLEVIANDPKLEPRYKQCAKAALQYGKEVANHQI